MVLAMRAERESVLALEVEVAMAEVLVLRAGTTESFRCLALLVDMSVMMRLAAFDVAAAAMMRLVERRRTGVYFSSEEEVVSVLMLVPPFARSESEVVVIRVWRGAGVEWVNVNAALGGLNFFAAGLGSAPGAEVEWLRDGRVEKRLAM